LLYKAKKEEADYCITLHNLVRRRRITVEKDNGEWEKKTYDYICINKNKWLDKLY